MPEGDTDTWNDNIIHIFEELQAEGSIMKKGANCQDNVWGLVINSAAPQHKLHHNTIKNTVKLKKMFTNSQARFNEIVVTFPQPGNGSLSVHAICGHWFSCKRGHCTNVWKLPRFNEPCKRGHQPCQRFRRIHYAQGRKLSRQCMRIGN